MKGEGNGGQCEYSQFQKDVDTWRHRAKVKEHNEEKDSISVFKEAAPVLGTAVVMTGM